MTRRITKYLVKVGKEIMQLTFTPQPVEADKLCYEVSGIGEPAIIHQHEDGRWKFLTTVKEELLQLEDEISTVLGLNGSKQLNVTPDGAVLPQ